MGINLIFVKLFWLVDNLNFDITRNRLRVFHFARYFHQSSQFEPVISDSPREIYNQLEKECILIVNRKLDRSILSLLYKEIEIHMCSCFSPALRGKTEKMRETHEAYQVN